METLTAKLEGTRRHLFEEGEAFFARTRDAGATFVAETGRAGAAFARAARGEARGWARFLRTRSPALPRPSSFAGLRPDLERRLLSRVDAAIATVGGRVRARLTELRPTPRRATTATRRPSKGRPRRARRAPVAAAAA